MMRRASSRIKKESAPVDAPEVVNSGGENKKKRPRQGQGSGHQAKRGPKTKEYLSAQLHENVARAARDPYHVNDPERYPRCTLEDHLRKKNCSDNPRCLFGLGEGKEGIWSPNPRHILALGIDLSGTLASRPGGDSGRNARPDENSSKVGVHPPGQRRLPAGLKNLGATCYLNSQLQALFANRRFRAGVYAWSPSQRGQTGAAGRNVSLAESDGGRQPSSTKRRRAPPFPSVAENEVVVVDSPPTSSSDDPSALYHKAARRETASAAKSILSTQSDYKATPLYEKRSVGMRPGHASERERCLRDPEASQGDEVTASNDDASVGIYPQASNANPKGSRRSDADEPAVNAETLSVPIEPDQGEPSIIARDKLHGDDGVNIDPGLDLSDGSGGGVSFVDVDGAMNDDSIMEELQRVFGHMQEGVAKVYDPAPFANLLGIDKGIQQDPQEFNKLLMSLLERCLQRSAPPLRGLVSGLFCGELAYVTRCLTCGNASKNKNVFNELELQIGDNRTVEACLDGFLAQESLEGDNQYLCEQCASKRDAVRAIELHRLPPVLSIQLLRYVYDFRTGQRKKIKAPISLPPTLDMGPRLRPQGKAGVPGKVEVESVYELGCVLYHKGSNVHSGHYIAEVRDSNSDAWILFDDEKVQLVRRGGSSKKDPSASASVGVSVGAGRNNNGAGNGAGGSPASVAGNNGAGNGCERKPKGGGQAGQAGGGGKRTKSTSKRKGQSAKTGGAAGESDAEAGGSKDGSAGNENGGIGAGGGGGEERSSLDSINHVKCGVTKNKGKRKVQPGAMFSNAKGGGSTSNTSSGAVDAAGAASARGLSDSGRVAKAGGKSTGRGGAEDRRHRGKRRKVVEDLSPDENDGHAESEIGNAMAPSADMPSGGDKVGGREDGGGGKGTSCGACEGSLPLRVGKPKGADKSTVPSVAPSAAPSVAPSAAPLMLPPEASDSAVSSSGSDAVDTGSGTDIVCVRVDNASRATTAGQLVPIGRRRKATGARRSKDGVREGGSNCVAGVLRETGALGVESKAAKDGGKHPKKPKVKTTANKRSGGNSTKAAAAGVEEPPRQNGILLDGDKGVRTSFPEAVEIIDDDDGDEEDSMSNIGDVEGDGTAGDGVGSGANSGGNTTSGARGASQRRKGSEDAYMLIYVHKGFEWGAASGGLLEPVLPPHVQAAVRASNEALTSEVARYEREKKCLGDKMGQRRARFAKLFGIPPGFTIAGTPVARKYAKDAELGKGAGVTTPGADDEGNHENTAGNDEGNVEGASGKVDGREQEQEGAKGEETAAAGLDGVTSSGFSGGVEAGGKSHGEANTETVASAPKDRQEQRSVSDSTFTARGDGDWGERAAIGGAESLSCGVANMERSAEHPGPSDEELRDAPDDVQAAWDTSVEAREESDLQRAMSASLASISVAEAGFLTSGGEMSAASSAVSQEDGSRGGEAISLPSASRALPPSKYFWVESHWLRQWVMGEEILPSDGGESTAAKDHVSTGKATWSGDSVLLDEASEVLASSPPRPPCNRTLREGRGKEGGNARSSDREDGHGEHLDVDEDRSFLDDRIENEDSSEAGRDMGITGITKHHTKQRKESGFVKGSGDAGGEMGGEGNGLSGTSDCGAGSTRRRSECRHQDQGVLADPPSWGDKQGVMSGQKCAEKREGAVRQTDDSSAGGNVTSARLKSGGVASGVSETGGAGERARCPGGDRSEDRWERIPQAFSRDRGMPEAGTGCSAGVSGGVKVTSAKPGDFSTSGGVADGCRESRARVFVAPMRHAHLLCEHGRVHPNSVSRLKLVTRKVYEGLLEEEGMSPPDHHLTATNYRCERCIRNHIGEKESNIAASRQSGALVAEVEKPEPQWDWIGEDAPAEHLEHRPFVISRKWVADFKAYHDQFLRSAAKMEEAQGGKPGGFGSSKGGAAGGRVKGASKPPPDPRVNTNITCKHGKLVSTRKGAKSRYRLISVEGWAMALGQFPRAAELEYPAGTPPCTKCQEQYKDDNQLKIERRIAKNSEFANGPTLKGLCRRGGSLPARLTNPQRGFNKDDGQRTLGDKFYLVESWWLASWRAYHDTSSKYSDPPPMLSNQGLRCHHGRAIMGPRLRQVVEGQLPAAVGVEHDGDGREGEGKGATTAEVVTDAEWNDLSKSYCILRPPAGEEGVDDPEIVRGDDDVGKSSEAETGSFTFVVSFTGGVGWDPPVCEECMTAASDRADMARTVFQDKAVNVVRLKEGESAPVPDPSTTVRGLGGVSLSATGRPQRKTRGKGGQPIVVTCSSDETLNFFKLKVYQATEVPPKRQTLFLAGVQLAEGSDTLKQGGIKVGDTIYLQVEQPSEEGDGSLDDTQLFVEAIGDKPPPGPEMGFAGTALSGRRNSPASPSALAPHVTGVIGSGIGDPFSQSLQEEAMVLGEGEPELREVDLGSPPPQQPWPCPSCTFINDLMGDFTHCSACGGDLFK